MKETRIKIRKFLKGYGVKVIFTKYTSNANNPESIVRVATECEEDKVWSNALHELHHILCYREGIYKEYHELRYPCDQATAMRIREIGLEAEIFVDKCAEKHFYELFPDKTFHQAYRNESDREWYQRCFLDKWFPIEQKEKLG